MTVNPWKPIEPGEFIPIEEYGIARKYWGETLLNLIADINGRIDILSNPHLDKTETPEDYLVREWFALARSVPSISEKEFMDKCNKENKLIIINLFHDRHFGSSCSTAFGTDLREAVESVLAAYYLYVGKSKKQEIHNVTIIPKKL